MTKTLKVYKGDDVVVSEQGEGKVSVTLSSLEVGITYPKGTHQVAQEENDKESSKVDAPQLKTSSILVSGVSLISETKSIMANTDDSVEPNIVPSTATSKILKHASEYPEFATVDENTGTVHSVVEGTSAITVMSTDGSNKLGQIPVTVTNRQGFKVQYIYAFFI